MQIKIHVKNDVMTIQGYLHLLLTMYELFLFAPWGIRSSFETGILCDGDVLYEVAKKEFLRSLYLKCKKKPVELLQGVFLILSC